MVEPALIEAAGAIATNLKWTGTVRNVFRYGGKVLIIVGVATDVYKVYVALSGPWAWAAHGVGTLASGSIGYWIGSGITRTIYELVIEE